MQAATHYDILYIIKLSMFLFQLYTSLDIVSEK